MPDTKIKLALVDDHKLFRNGMASMLQDYEELSLTFEASNGIEFFEEITRRKRPVDILLLDLEMPEMDGIAVLEKLRSLNTGIKPLVITRHSEDELVYELVRLGARGMLQKDADIEEVVDAIHIVYEGELYFHEDVSKVVIKKLAKKTVVKNTITEVLTDREREIVQLICSEHTTKEIADKLCISERTVDVHKKNIFTKTNSRNTAGIIMYAMRRGIVE